jgi:hypothetical protein
MCPHLDNSLRQIWSLDIILSDKVVEEIILPNFLELFATIFTLWSLSIDTVPMS